MHFSTISSLLLGAFSLTAAAPTSKREDPTKLVYQFSKGTWIENLAVRPGGSVLLSEGTGPNLYLIDPSSASPAPTLLHTFPDALSLLGIAETTPDTFYVVVSNFSLATFTAAPHSNRLFRVHFPLNSAMPEVSLAASLPDALMLNGLARLDDNTILAADSFKGVVWAIDTQTGESRIALSGPAFAPTQQGPLGIVGVNGVHRHDRTLFFTNTATGSFSSIPINSDGSAAGPISVISHVPAGGNYDDFTLDHDADAAFLVTGSGNSLARMKIHCGAQQVVAGNLNSTEIAEPTAAAFGRTAGDRETVYIVTGGGLGAPVDVDGKETVVGAQLVAVKVGRS
jgi:hypothetical protein